MRARSIKPGFFKNEEDRMAIEILEFRPVAKGYLQGFITVKIPKIGMEIRDIALFEKGGGKWVNLPRREYDKKDGTKGWTELVRFTERTIHEKFQQEVLEALEEHLKKDPKKVDDSDIPF
jgi:hypothetical protein